MIYVSTEWNCHNTQRAALCILLACQHSAVHGLQPAWDSLLCPWAYLLLNAIYSILVLALLNAHIITGGPQTDCWEQATR